MPFEILAWEWRCAGIRAAGAEFCCETQFMDPEPILAELGQTRSGYVNRLRCKIRARSTNSRRNPRHVRPFQAGGAGPPGGALIEQTTHMHPIMDDQGLAAWVGSQLGGPHAALPPRARDEHCAHAASGGRCA